MKTTKGFIKGILIVFAGATMLLGVVESIARADVLTFALDKGNGSTLPDAPYGSVTLTLNGSAIDIAVDLTASHARLVNTGIEAAFAFNSSIIPDPTISVTGFPAGFSLISGSPGSVHMDGFGYFEYGVVWDGGPGGSSPDGEQLSFTVTRSGGFTTANELVENSTGGGIVSPFSADIITATGITGAIGAELEDAPPPVPEPATLLLLGSGLIGLVGYGRKKFFKK